MIATVRTPRVVIVHDLALVAKAMCRLLTSERMFDVIGDARSVDDAKLFILRPDLLLLHLDGNEDSLEKIVAVCRKASPSTRIVLLTAHATPALMQRCLSAGIEGYVRTDVDSAELVHACETVAMGDAYFDPRVAGGLLRRLHAGTPDENDLSMREIDILSQVATGLANKDIAANLHLSPKTVKNHLSRIFAKLGLADRTQAAVYALRNGLA